LFETSLPAEAKASASAGRRVYQFRHPGINYWKRDAKLFICFGLTKKSESKGQFFGQKPFFYYICNPYKKAMSNPVKIFSGSSSRYLA